MAKPRADVSGFEEWVSVRTPRWPDRKALWWQAHQRRRHADRLLWQKWLLAYELFRRDVYARQPFQGNVLQMLREGRLTIGPGSQFDAVTIRGNDGARILLGAGVGLNRNVTVGAGHLIVIGDHTLVGQGSYITDVNHEISDPERPIEEQGFSTRGPTVIEDNVWIGANSVITSGVRIGRRSVVAANTVVTRSVPPFSIVRGTQSRSFPRPGRPRRPETTPCSADEDPERVLLTGAGSGPVR